MALQAKLVQKMGQSLLMTPQLQQAIKLLQLGRLEYIEAIQKELLENPILEESKSETSEEAPSFTSENQKGAPLEEPSQTTVIRELDQALPTPSETGPNWEEYLQNYTDYRGAATPKGLIDTEDRPSLEASLTRGADLSDHLIDQIRMSGISREDSLIALHIVGNLDVDGYLCAEYAEIAQTACCEEGDVERVIEDHFRNFDPPGCAARDLKECLTIQLDVLGRGTGLEARIVNQHLDKVESRKLDAIAKAEKISLDQVIEAVTFIQKLEPKPGRPFADEDARYIIPDIYVYKDSGEWVITLNEDGLPKLKVSPYYLQLLKDQGPDGDTNRAYLNERLKAASWLIKSIHQRQQTIYKVTQSIVRFQAEFLEHGVSQLKPLVLRQVADDISMHESTVSRVTTNKYVHTPQGVFELKYFFTTGIKTASGDVSSSTVKDRIKTIIAQESSDAPISDQQIVDLLKAENIEIARRTVAKYRESLGIASSSRRKKLF